MQIVLMVGAYPYPLDESDVRWLEQRIRTTCVDDSHRPLDADALVCLQLADMLADDLEVAESSVIDLGHSQARGLTEHVLGLLAAQEHGIQELYEALLRFRGASS